MALKSCTEEREKFLKRNKKDLTNIRKQKLIGFKEKRIKYEVIKTYSNHNTILVDSSHSKGTLNKECLSDSFTFSFTYSSICPRTMATYCPQYIPQQTYTFPIVINKWDATATAVPTPIYSTPIPQVPFIANSHMMGTQICPYIGGIITEPLIAAVVPQAIIPESVSGITENFYKPISCCLHPEPEQTTTLLSVINDQTYYKLNKDINLVEDAAAITGLEELNSTEDPLQFYLNLPHELFPCARSLALDPNPIIDEFCKQSNMDDHAAWILDLEFGVPRAAITRAIPIYDVKFNSIHCKNTPSAIHPGFENCNENFKQVLLFYYDCIISAWYRGYVIMNNDRSVENFQTWLLIAMQFYGMCWP